MVKMCSWSHNRWLFETEGIKAMKLRISNTVCDANNLILKRTYKICHLFGCRKDNNNIRIGFFSLTEFSNSTLKPSFKCINPSKRKAVFLCISKRRCFLPYDLI